MTGTPIVLYDGSPTYPDPMRLWGIAADHKAALLSVSPGYLTASGKAGLHPEADLDLNALRTLGRGSAIAVLVLKVVQIRRENARETEALTKSLAQVADPAQRAAAVRRAKILAVRYPLLNLILTVAALALPTLNANIIDHGHTGNGRCAGSSLNGIAAVSA